MSTRPRPQDFPTWWSYHQAKRVGLRQQGGRLSATLAVALIFGGLTGSLVLTLLLVLFAVVGTVYARSRP